MNMIPMQSSNVTHVGYENGIMAVRFMNGGEYHYDGISQDQYAAMLGAQSPGRFLRESIMPEASRVLRVK